MEQWPRVIAAGSVILREKDCHASVICLTVEPGLPILNSVIDVIEERVACRDSSTGPKFC